MKFPKRRSIGFSEWMNIFLLGFHSLYTGDDPGYNGQIQTKFKESFLRWFDESHDSFLEVAGSGTNAIYVGIKALNLPPKSVVHVSPITDPGTIGAILLNDLYVNILDVVSGTCGQTCLSSLKTNILPNSSGVVLIHHAGWPAQSDLFRTFCHDNHLAFFEDFSQSIGATISGKKVGSFADISAASTMYRKTLATGGSGGIIFSRQEFAKSVSLHKDRGKPIWKSDFYDNFLANRDGNNVQLAALNHNQDDLNLCIGLSSLNRLPSVIRKRVQLVHKLREHLDSSVCIPYDIDSSSPFIIPLTFSSDKLKSHVVSSFDFYQIPCNPDYKFNVSHWDWVTPYHAGNCITPNANTYLSRTIFLYLNERYEFSHIRSISNVVNNSILNFQG